MSNWYSEVPSIFLIISQLLLQEVFDDLFLLPCSKNRYLPKCKSNSSRCAAYDLLIELVRGSWDNYRLLHGLLINQHSKEFSSLVLAVANCRRMTRIWCSHRPKHRIPLGLLAKRRHSLDQWPRGPTELGRDLLHGHLHAAPVHDTASPASYSPRQGQKTPAFTKWAFMRRIYGYC